MGSILSSRTVDAVLDLAAEPCTAHYGRAREPAGAALSRGWPATGRCGPKCRSGTLAGPRGPWPAPSGRGVRCTAHQGRAVSPPVLRFAGVAGDRLIQYS